MLNSLKPRARTSTEFGFTVRSLAVALLLMATFSISAQQPQPPPGQPDPLVALMAAQPQIDLNKPITAAAVFDPPVIDPGGRAIYRLTFNAIEDSIDLPDPLPAPEGLPLQPGAHAQSLQMGGPSTIEPRTSLLFHTFPPKAGTFTIPEFTVQVYGKPVTVPAATLHVTEHLPPNAPQAQMLLIEVPAGNVYVGQAFRPRIMLPFTYAQVQTLSHVALTGGGFISDQSGMRQRIEPLKRGGTNLVTFVHEPLLTPIAAGKLSFRAHSWVLVPRRSPLVFTNNVHVSLPNDQILLDSEMAEVNVLPLPKQGILPGFTGAVGLYTNDPPQLSASVLEIGEQLKMRITFRGDGNLARLVPPPAPQSPDWQVFEASGDPNPPGMIYAQGAITFTYTLMPLTASVSSTPPFPFSYFDPYKGTYLDLSIPPLAVKVLPAAAQGDTDAIHKAVAVSRRPEDRLTLSGMAAVPGMAAASLIPVQRRPWFPLIQVAPALGFLGLWVWDKRRRYLLRHPEILRCRRARRVLRKQIRAMRQASETRDAPAFARAAVSAMQVAGAPHFPAEPRALVSRDILEVLDENDRNGRSGEVVRFFYRATDEALFGRGQGDGAELLLMEPEIMRVLSKLDQKLVLPERSHPVAFWTLAGWLLAFPATAATNLSPAEALFQQGTNAYASSDYAAAARAFREASALRPASGTFQNLGLSEWSAGNTGDAILAWERALWLDTFNRSAQQNLEYARTTAQVESPELAWYEVISSWLPVNVWPWITGASLWLGVGMVVLPGVFGNRKEGWHQAVAATALMLFLLSLPAHLGIHTRARLGYVLQKDAALRLTPTAEGQILTVLAPGQPARLRKVRGDYLLVKAGRYSGWIETAQLGLVCPPNDTFTTHHSMITVGPSGNLPHSAP